MERFQYQVVVGSSSRYADNRKKDILIFGKGLTDGLSDITLTVEVKQLVTFSE